MVQANEVTRARAAAAGASRLRAFGLAGAVRATRGTLAT